MAEVSALRKHPCPECGGDAEWDASKKALACPYCGTIVPWSEGEDPMGAAIVEHDLEEALVEERAHSGDGKHLKQAVRCESCRAISEFDGTRVAQRCDFCGSPAIIPTELEQTITPESLLPAVIPSTEVRTLLRTWYGSRWFAPNRLKRAALTDTVHGIYLPYWTFDAFAQADWTAESGYHYYVTESYTDSNGRSQTRQVQRTRWEWTSGHLDHFFDDDLVPGTVGVSLGLLRKVEPFPTTKDLKPFDPAYIRGWTVERYQVDLTQASKTNEQQMEAELYRLCAREVPGDTHRSLNVEATYRDRTFKHILVPVWLTTYTYGSKSFQVIVNGYTGQMAGERPYSWVKIFFAVVFALIAAAILYLWLGK